MPKRRTRTHRHRVTTDTWTGDKEWHEPRRVTHRLRNLGITSPFDLPKDPYLLLELFAIVLYKRIHFLSVKTSHYFQVISEPLNLTLRATRITGQFELIPNNWRAGFPNLQPQLHHPLIAQLEGRPRTCTSSIFGTFQGEPPRPKRFNNRTGGPDNNQLSNSLRKSPVYISNVQESPVAKKLTAKVSHMVTWQLTTIRRNQGRRPRLKTPRRT